MLNHKTGILPTASWLRKFSVIILVIGYRELYQIAVPVYLQILFPRISLIMACHSTEPASSSSSSPPELELFMRAGWEHGELGASPESQSVFMYLLLKEAAGYCSFTVSVLFNQ